MELEIAAIAFIFFVAIASAGMFYCGYQLMRNEKVADIRLE